MIADVIPRTPTTYIAALTAYRKGISVVPIPPIGAKCPAIPWKEYQQRRATIPEIIHWFAWSQDGLAFITGAVSGNLECLDFDTHAIYHQWSELMYAEGCKWLHNRLTQSYLEATPNGIHLLYRCPSIVEGNQKLARGEGGKSLIETRGEGGLVVVAPSCGSVHPSGKPYVLQQGSIATIPTISQQDRFILFLMARRLDVPPPEEIRLTRTPSSRPTSTRRPGDIYEERATWQQVLEPHGWTYLGSYGQEEKWQRPNKKGKQESARVGHNGHDLLYVFSTSAYPFEGNRAYTKFTAYAMLNHGGNFSDAAKALAEQGYTD